MHKPNRNHLRRSFRSAAVTLLTLLTVLSILAPWAPPARALVGPSTVAPAADTRWIAAIEDNCTGSLIAANYILTAAHCLDPNGRFVPQTVTIGWHNFDDPADSRTDSITRGIAQRVKHPLYRPGDRQHDIAVVRLSKPVTDREPVRIGAPGIASDYDGVGEPWTDLTLYGYGKTVHDGPRSPIPRKLQTKLRDHRFMESVWNSPEFFNYARSRHLGAGGNLGRGPEGGCNADSGGPMVGSGAHYQTRTRGEHVHANYTGPIVMGVFSSILGYCGTNPGLYMRVDQGALLDWVVETVNDPLYCGDQVRFGVRNRWKLSTTTNQASCTAP